MRRKKNKKAKKKRKEERGRRRATIYILNSFNSNQFKSNLLQLKFHLFEFKLLSSK